MLDINERPELEAVARAEMMNYLQENAYLYETLFDEFSNRMDADATEEEIDQEIQNHMSNMFVFAFQAVQEKLSEQK